MKIKRLPNLYFIENGVEKPFWAEHIERHINKLTLSEAAEISKYMESAPLIVAWMGSIEDPFDSTKNVGTGEYSDGVYAWEDLDIHYVKNYKVRMPKEFMEHIFQYNGDIKHLALLDTDSIHDNMRKSVLSENGTWVAEDLTVRIGYT